MTQTNESHRNSPLTRRCERGISLVFFTLALPVVIALLGLVLGGGLLMINKARLTDVAEMAAFSALKAYQASTLPTFDERADEALSEANLILSKNRLPNSSGALEPLGRTGPTTGGQLFLGSLLREPPPSGPAPAICSGSYPCFVPYNPAAPSTVDAVKIELHAAGLGAVRVPYFNRLMTVSARLTAATLNTATILLLDTSTSMAFDSHGYTGGSAPSRAAYPPSVQSAVCAGASDPIIQSWCGLQPTRTTFVTFNPRIHFRNDYKLSGGMLIDSFLDFSANYIGPQPLSAAFLMANIALRKSAAASFPGDSWRLIAVRGATPEILPPLNTPPLGRPDYLVQLTNFDNRGLYDANQTLLRPYPHTVHPNAIDKGLLPDPTIAPDQTPLAAGIRAAIQDLGALRKGVTKRLIIISDGVGNCSNALGCVDSIDGYQAAEAELSALAPQLVAASIDVTVIPLGETTSPHILNIEDPLNPATELGPNFLTPEAAADLDYTGIGAGNLFFDSSPVVDLAYQTWCQNPTSGCSGCNAACQERYAYTNRGKPGVLFRRPMAALGDLALTMMRAKLGRLCLIQPPASDTSYGDYDGNPGTAATLNPNLREINKPQLQSLVFGEPGQQLNECLDSAPRAFGMEVALRD